jgi:hypothetical protein
MPSLQQVSWRAAIVSSMSPSSRLGYAGMLSASARGMSAAVRALQRHPIVAITAWFVLVAVATGVWRDVPVIDDWTYAWTVEHLLHTGSFQVLDWSSAYPLSQAVWGAIWSALLGFSFASLRFSTLILGIVGCSALYLTIRELGASPHIALLGALSLAVNPVFIFLSSSFMTDVPFIAFSMLALLCYVRAADRGDIRLVWWAGVWSMAAFLTRQVGIVTPVAGLPLLLMRPVVPAMSRVRVAVALAVTWAVIIVTGISMKAMLGSTSAMDRWAWNLYANHASSFPLNGSLFVIVCFYALPALLIAASVRGVWRRPLLLVCGAVASAVVLFLLMRDIPLPLRPDQTWSIRELGASRSLVAGSLPDDGATWIRVLLRAAGLLATTLFLAIAWLGRRELITWMSGVSRGRGPLIAYLGAYFVLVNLLWMFHDRYYLAMIPPLIALALGTREHVAPRLRVATVVMVLFGILGLIGTHDALRFNQAVHDTVQSLVDSGIPRSRIDAGYAWNGWMLYAHPSNLAPGSTPLRDVPWITSADKLPYIIAKTAHVDGYVVEREQTWHSLPWPRPNRLFVLKQLQSEPADAGP